jgi:hypothetical protein
MTTIKNKPISSEAKKAMGEYAKHPENYARDVNQMLKDNLEAKVQKTKWQKKAEAYARKK